MPLSDVEAHLLTLGFTYVETRVNTRVYERGLDEFTIRAPNVNGDLPEIIVNDALDNAGLPVPNWRTYWCD